MFSFDCSIVSKSTRGVADGGGGGRDVDDAMDDDVDDEDDEGRQSKTMVLY